VVRSRGELSRELALVLADLRAGEPFTTAMEGLGTALGDVLRAPAANAREERKRGLIEAGGHEIFMLLPVVFLLLPVVVLFALYPGYVGLIQLAR
jgi:tight adherence protein C